MYHAGTVPQYHVSTRLFVDISPKVPIWRKNEGLVCRKALDDFLGIAARTDDIAQSLHTGTAVDVGNYQMIGIFVFELLEQCWWCRIAQ